MGAVWVPKAGAEVAALAVDWLPNTEVAVVVGVVADVGWLPNKDPEVVVAPVGWLTNIAADVAVAVLVGWLPPNNDAEVVAVLEDAWLPKLNPALPLLAGWLPKTVPAENADGLLTDVGADVVAAPELARFPNDDNPELPLLPNTEPDASAEACAEEAEASCEDEESGVV